MVILSLWIPFVLLPDIIRRGIAIASVLLASYPSSLRRQLQRSRKATTTAAGFPQNPIWSVVLTFLVDAAIAIGQTRMTPGNPSHEYDLAGPSFKFLRVPVYPKSPSRNQLHFDAPPDRLGAQWRARHQPIAPLE